MNSCCSSEVSHSECEYWVWTAPWAWTCEIPMAWYPSLSFGSLAMVSQASATCLFAWPKTHEIDSPCWPSVAGRTWLWQFRIQSSLVDFDVLVARLPCQFCYSSACRSNIGQNSGATNRASLSTHCTGWLHRIKHRKWRETKLQPCRARPVAWL